MRKLKFRAWSEEQKKFIQGYPLGEEQKNGFTVCGISENGEQETTSDGLVLMQFTGLLDKNGVEIYESDIVRYTRLRTMMDGLITYTQKIPNIDEHSEWSVLMLHMKEIEVIGNIYQHENLLT